jgi:HEAT repeat protein
MRSMLVSLLTPCAVMTVAGLALAQPAPAPLDAPRPEFFEFADKIERAQFDLDKLEKLPKFEFDKFEKLAKIGEKFGEAFKPGEFYFDGFEKREELAKIAAQIDGLKPGAMPGPVKIHKARSCGEGSIDSIQESDSVYDCGRQALDRAAWDEALQSFSRVAAARLGTRAAGAIYWRAYSQNRLGQRAEALATLGELKSGFPSSGWVAEANALEVEIRQSSGQRVSPDSSTDDDLKLLALQGLANSDSDQAVPLIENVLKGAQSPRVKERALFVLAQSNKPAARDVVVRVAKGGSNPDLQLKAVQFVGMFRSVDGLKVLSEIYGTTQDYAVRRAILRSYMMAGAREPLVAAARQETMPELRLEAVRQLGNMKAGTELAELYAKETSPEVKKQILRGLANGAQNDKLVALAQSETNPELRRTAIRSLGLNRDSSTGAILTQLYAKEQAQEVREAVLDALYTSGNATALVTLARQEKDPALKLLIVRRLSTMRAQEARDYMLELLK